MKPLSRRSVIAGSAAAVTVIPTLGLCKSPKTVSGATMSELIHRYRQHIDAICHDCDVRDMDDDELDARCDRSYEFLNEAIRLPAVTPEDATAALDLVLEDDGSRYQVFGEHRAGLLSAVKAYTAARA